MRRATEWGFSRCGRQMGPRSSVSAAVVIPLSLVTAFHSHSAASAPSTNAAPTGWRDFQKHRYKPAMYVVHAIVTIATCALLIWAREIRSYGGSVKCDLQFECLPVWAWTWVCLSHQSRPRSGWRMRQSNVHLIQEWTALPVRHRVHVWFRLKRKKKKVKVIRRLKQALEVCK